MNINIDPYQNYPVIKNFTNGMSGITSLLQNNIVRKIYTTDIQTRMSKEIRALKKLSDYDHFPKLIHVHKNIIYMTYCGISIKNMSYSQLPIDYEEQADEIIDALKTEDIFHKDIAIEHITVKDNTLYLIDFEKSFTQSELHFARKLNLTSWKDMRYHDLNYLKTCIKNYTKDKGKTSKINTFNYPRILNSKKI